MVIAMMEYAVSTAVGLVRATGICIYDVSSSPSEKEIIKGVRSWQVMEFAVPAVPNQAPVEPMVAILSLKLDMAAKKKTSTR